MLKIKRPLALAMLLLVMAAALLLWGCASGEDPALITDYNGLMRAIGQAADGDVLLVGDIDFSPTSPDVPNSFMCVEVDKGITLRSGKANGGALFTNAGFLLSGSKASGMVTAFRFENIIFDGKADASALTAEDFAYPWSEVEQEYTYYAPMQAQQALSFRGNVDAIFSNCVFRNYMHEYGPVADLRYGDYTDNSYLLDLFGDQSGCAVGLYFDGCAFENNAALYDGGAVFIDANRNVTLTATDCSFTGNRSGAGEFCRGGGFLFASGAELRFEGCSFDGNVANYCYPGAALPDFDTNKGGALLLEGSSLTMTDSRVVGNQASMGGALSLTNTRAELDGCSFTGNRAQGNGRNPDGLTGPWSNMGQGGAIYAEGMNGASVKLYNCLVEGNSASDAYGGIYGYYTPHEDLSLGTYYLELKLCTYRNNTVDAVYDYTAQDIYPWVSHPGNLLENAHLSLFGCLLLDDSFAADFPTDQQPTQDNGYCRIGPAGAEAEAAEIPAQAARQALGGRYGDKLRAFHVGSNYTEALYRDQPEPQGFSWYALAAMAAVLAAGWVVLFHRRRRLPAKTAPAAEEAPAPVHIVMSRYNDAQIAHILEAIPQTQLLTGRELEVLQEMLRGRKQGEVAYQLGIEVSTVKDFYRKIYGKLNVANKDGIFALADEAMHK